MIVRKRKILMIDDEKDFCQLMKWNLEQTGEYEVIFITDGRLGVKAVHQHKPDLILLDIVMSGMSGLEVLKKLKEDRTTVAIPVMMLTALQDEQSKRIAGRLYDEDYIEKPVQIEVLREKIKKILSRIGKQD